MKTIIRVICTTVLASSLLLMPKAALAGCSSCDGFMDNGQCDKSDINDKFCGFGPNKNCFSGGCDGGTY